MSQSKLGVVSIFDARGTTKLNPNDSVRVLWEYGLVFFKKHCAQRIVLDEIGNVIFRFPKLA